MIGVWLEDGRISVRRELPDPRSAPGEAVIRVLAAGICGTDLELVRGYRPFRGIPGHEFVGRVEEGPGEWPGSRVVGDINVTCDARGAPPCPACAAGRASHCRDRTVVGITGRDGAFAERLLLPAANLHRVPDGVSDEAAAFAEPLGAAFRILEQVDVGPGDDVLVLGPGRLGQLVARVLGRTGCRLTVAGRSAAGLSRADAPGVATRPAASLGEREFDIAIDCTGDPAGFDAARATLRPGGRLVLKSTYARDLPLDASRLVVDEITVIGSRCGPLPAALEALSAGAVEVEDLIDDRFPLEAAPRAFERAAEPGVLKVLLRP